MHKEALQRIAHANTAPAEGQGIPSEHFVPLCLYHSVPLAKRLKEELIASSVLATTRQTRLHVEFEVSFEDRHKAKEIVDEFRSKNPDIVPKTFRRDFDIVFLVGGLTLVLAAASAVIPSVSYARPFSVLCAGGTLCFATIRIGRNIRMHGSYQFSLQDALLATALIAVNIACWRLLF
ncbi:MAG: hypothetical protein AB8B50_16865 [Pirellulaceae bacterium]